MFLDPINRKLERDSERRRSQTNCNPFDGDSEHDDLSSDSGNLTRGHLSINIMLIISAL